MVSFLGESSHQCWLKKSGVPEVSTIVVVRLLSAPGGMVITGTIVWIFEMKASFTRDVISLKVSWSMHKAIFTLTCLLPELSKVSLLIKHTKRVTVPHHPLAPVKY